MNELDRDIGEEPEDPEWSWLSQTFPEHRKMEQDKPTSSLGHGVLPPELVDSLILNLRTTFLSRLEELNRYEKTEQELREIQERVQQLELISVCVIPVQSLAPAGQYIHLSRGVHCLFPGCTHKRQRGKFPGGSR